ncbi:MAG: hypothetical protein KJ065_27725 [Anaerolineae bacterium]|nr:hypothetical protein [Anaerolineae bacterium]
MPRTGFHPVDDGFKFRNDFVNPIINIPLLGVDVETSGRCGGMAFLALDYWYNKLPIPETTALPRDGTLLADTIYARLADSMLANGWRFFEFMNMLDHPTQLRGKGAARVTREDEFPKIRASIDAGMPCALGLAKAREIGQLGNDHWVVCHGYTTNGSISRLLIYDNNYPDKEVILEFTTEYDPGNRSVRHSLSGVEWRGFFMGAYAPRRPWYMNGGIALKESNAAPVHQIKAGAACWISSPEEFAAVGLDWSQVRSVGDGSLGQIEQYPGDGSVVRDRNAPEVCVVFGGKPFWIPSPAELEALGYHWEDVVILPSGSISRMRSTPRERTLLKERTKPEVYAFLGGVLRHILSPEALTARGFSWDNVRVVPDGALTGIPVGAPIRGDTPL